MSLFRRDAHLPDATLLLLLEGDLRGRALRHAEQHLSACPACRWRRFTLQSTSRQVEQDTLHDSRAGDDVSTAEPGAARERLAALLAREAQVMESGWRGRLRRNVRLSILLRVAALLALLATAVAWRQSGLPSPAHLIASEDTGPEPNHALTPGSADPVALAELCGRSDSDLDPQLSPEKERAVFNAYGISQRAARAYQVDYLINPQLGGNDRMENLWPEPYHATVWNARAKDALEARLHGMVCNGQVGLQNAQQELSTDWIAAYKKYFHTQRPVSTVAGLDHASMPASPLP